jgi:hypothetical protein
MSATTRSNLGGDMVADRGHVAVHRLGQLRVDFVGDGHDVGQEETEIQSAEILLQGSEEGDLEDARVVHQHSWRVALQLSHLAMGDSGEGSGRIVFQPGSVRFPQANNQVFDQLGKIAGAVFVGEGDATEFFTVSYSPQPVFDDGLGTTLENRRDSFFSRTDGRDTILDLLVDEFGEFAGREGFQDDIVGLENNGVHGALHVRVTADQKGERVWLGVAHCGHYGKTVAGVRHVQVGDQHVEGHGCDEFQSSGHAGGGGYVESLASERHSHCLADGFVVVDEQDSVRNAGFEFGHEHHFFLGINCREYDLFWF